MAHRRRGTRLLIVGVIVLAAATFVARADASHLRFASVSAESTGGYSYAFTFSMGEAGCGTIGDPLTLLQLDYGDSNTDFPEGSVSATQCVGAFLWEFAPAAATHTYSPTLDGQTVTVSSDGGCRVALRNSPSGCALRSEASFVVGSGDSTPTMSVPPVVYCKTGLTCTFAIPASDPDGDPVRWRMSTDSEMGTTTSNPADMSVDAATGVVTWDTTGKTDGLWAANVTVEELSLVGAVKGKTAADFIVALGNYDAPVFVTPSPADGGTLTATVGQVFTIDLKANAPATKTAVLSSLGLPTWLTCPYGATADPATVTCTGTPTSVGSTQIVFLATASDGPQSARSYSVSVAAAAETPPASTPPAGTTAPLPPISVSSNAPASGYASGTDFSIHVAHAGAGPVLVSTSSDLSSPVSVDVAADGTLHYPLPQGIEGTVTLYIVRPEDGSTAKVSFTVDTKAPTLISVDHLRAPSAVSTAAAKRDPQRKWFKVRGVDAGSGITRLQIAPRAGVTWNWRSFVTTFSAPINQKTVRVRIADAAGNISGWFTVRVTRIK